MKNLLHELHEYFYFTRLERNASFTLFLLCSFFFLLPNIYPLIMPPKPEYDFTEYREAIMAAMAESKAKKETASPAPKFRGENKKAVPVELFKFDPNTATKEELIRLGILPRTANTLLNYRSKGGRFFKKEDLKKVYGFR
ncbi:MAG TPA: helix-hairpin-helix domain-containing protein, partial [Bacteroidetes bacterium]|nr:helix-hairpin-helix domain-containing protein [Bacteroidota bacterium]